MVLEPVEVFGYTLRGADKVKVDLDDGTDLGSLTASLEGSNYGIPYGSFLVDSIMNPSYGSFDGPSDVPPTGELLGGTNGEASCGDDS